jgi:hypothetical protein
MAAVTLEDKSIWDDAEVSCVSKMCFFYVKYDKYLTFVKFCSIMKTGFIYYYTFKIIFMFYLVITCLFIIQYITSFY